MGKCQQHYREIRFVIEDEQTAVYVLLDALGDCPLGVQGWHFKSFPKSIPIIDLLKTAAGDSVLWPLKAPD